MSTKLSLNPVRRLIKATTSRQIASGIPDYVRIEVERRLNSIARDASLRASGSERNTILLRDVKFSGPVGKPTILPGNEVRRGLKKFTKMRVSHDAVWAVAKECESHIREILQEAERLCNARRGKRIFQKDVENALVIIDGHGRQY